MFCFSIYFSGFCETCCLQLETCPLCRIVISSLQQSTESVNPSDRVSSSLAWDEQDERTDLPDAGRETGGHVVRDRPLVRDVNERPPTNQASSDKHPFRISRTSSDHQDETKTVVDND